MGKVSGCLEAVLFIPLKEVDGVVYDVDTKMSTLRSYVLVNRLCLRKYEMARSSCDVAASVLHMNCIFDNSPAERATQKSPLRAKISERCQQTNEVHGLSRV